MARLRVLVATDLDFWEQAQGNHRRIGVMLDCLRERGYDLRVVFVETFHPIDRASIPTDFHGISIVPLFREPPAVPLGEMRERIRNRHPYLTAIKRRLVNPVLSLAKEARRQAALWRDPFCEERTLSDFNSPKICSELESVCRDFAPDCVIVHYVHLGFLVPPMRAALPESSRILIDTHDVSWLRRKSLHEAGQKSWFMLTEQMERDILQQFDGVIAIQEREAEIFREMGVTKPIMVAGHSSRIHPPPEKQRRPIRVLFVGADVRPNRLALARLVGHIWPETATRLSREAELHLAGAMCRHLAADNRRPDMVVHGFVKDLESLWAQCHIFVNPVDIGAGLKIKNVEALCHGLPLVTTPHSLIGIQAAKGRGAVACDSDQALTDALVDLIENDARRESAADAALASAREMFSPDKVYGDLYAFIEQAVAASPDRSSGGV